MAMNVEAEIRDLKRRVSELEGSFGFLTRQIKDVHKDLLAFQARTDERFRRVGARFDGMDGRFDKIEKDVRGLRQELPGIVTQAVREGLRKGVPRRARSAAGSPDSAPLRRGRVSPRRWSGPFVER